MMRKLAFFCLVFSAGTATLAQAPAEWRPNISDINQAATYDDTIHFILTTLNDPSSSKVDIPEDKTHYGFYQETYGAKSDNHCQLIWDEIFSLHPATKRWETTVDLAKLDPLTIKVVPAKTSDGLPYKYDLEFAGTANEQFATSFFPPRLRARFISGRASLIKPKRLSARKTIRTSIVIMRNPSNPLPQSGSPIKRWHIASLVL